MSPSCGLQFWAGPYISGKSVHSCITQLCPIPTLWTHQMEGSHTVSYGKKVYCVFRRCERAISDYEKTGLQTKSLQTFINSFNRSFIRFRNSVMAIHELVVKEDKFPTIATQPQLRKLTKDALSFGKYQGVWHMMYSRQNIRLLSNAQDARDTVLNAPRWTNLTLYWINGDWDMRLWKLTIKPEMYSDDATYLLTRNSERRRGELKGTR